MKAVSTPVLTLSGLVFIFADGAIAQDIIPRSEVEIADPTEFEAEAGSSPGFHWEIEVELGTEQVFKSEKPGNEIHDTYADITIEGAYLFGNGVEIFSALSIESFAQPTSDLSFDDAGAFVEALGVMFNVNDSTALSFGKVQPVFGSAWDDTSGFFGATLAEDYELEEQISVLAEIEVGEANVLNFGAFFTDDTVLSESFGYNRGRNSTAEGGAGNTGKFNNVAVQWGREIGDSFFHIGARHLSAGEGDVYDENGIVAGLGHGFDNGIDVFSEVATFSHFEGESDNATYITLNATYTIGDLSFSGTLARREFETEGKTSLASVAAEYEFQNGMVLGGALAFIDDVGIEDQLLGLNLVIPLGN